MTVPRVLTAVLLALLGCLLAVAAAVSMAGRPVVEQPSSPVARAVADRAGPLAVLAGWDDARAEAWRRGDPAALARLYVDGSAAGRADLALLEAYADRGLRVRGLRMQRASVEVVTAEEERVVLRVAERLVGATVVGPRGRFGLPRDGWSVRRVELRAAGERWQVVEVREISATRPPGPT